MSHKTGFLRLASLWSLVLGGLIASAQTPAPTPPPPEPVTFTSVMEKLKVDPKGKDEEQIVEEKAQNEALVLSMIASASYVFDPTSEQLLDLKQAGASDRLLSALKQANTDITKPDASGVSRIDRLFIQQLSDRNVIVRAKAALALGRRRVEAAAPNLATLIASDTWDTGAALPGPDAKPEFFLFTDASKVHALATLLDLDRKAAERALMKAAESTESRVRAWATDILTTLAEPAAASDPFADPPSAKVP